jgi:hypothetical protein
MQSLVRVASCAALRLPPSSRLGGALLLVPTGVDDGHSLGHSLGHTL